MKRTLNYTGRSRIQRDRISILLDQGPAAPSSFSARIDLCGSGLPPDARVYVDAYHRTARRRFDFATAAHVAQPPDTSLAGLARIQSLQFRVLAVDESGQHGLILAHADRIKPRSDTDKRSILPVEFRDLDRQIWRIDYTGEDGAPVLLLNSKIPNIENMARTESQFVMYVYPPVIREVLTHMAFVEGVESPSDPSHHWQADWLAFTARICPSPSIPDCLDPADQQSFDQQQVQDWINCVVEEFCASREEWTDYLQFVAEGEKA